MQNTSLPEEVRTALLKYHLVQDDLLDLQVLLDDIEDLPDGTRYLPLRPGSTAPDRDPGVLSPKERFEQLMQCLECHVLNNLQEAKHELAVLRERYPNCDF
jgi:hypothetical protein